MTDIVDRLRAMAGPIVPNVCTEAADEIERLRRQVSTIEAMGFRWEWSRTVGPDGEQEGGWVDTSEPPTGDTAAKIERLRDLVEEAGK